jgi:4-amino-4-deoxy-L-arabinose transferase-like glycosyltransferase
VGSYLVLRLANLGALPPFVDELIYASKAQALATQSPLSLVWDGHGPSFFGAEYWVNHVIQPLVPAGRALSVVSGVASLVLLFLVGKRLWNPWVGLAAAALYVLSPFAITYDRMALVESFQAALMLGCLYLALLLATERRLVAQGVLAAVLAAVLVATIWVKLSSTVAIGWIVLGVVLGGKGRLNLTAIALAAVASGVGWLAYRWQFQNPAYQSATLEGLHFHARDVVLHPFATWVPRLTDFVLPTLVGYFTLPVLALVLASGLAVIVLLVRRRWDDDVRGAVIVAGCGAGALAAPIFYVSINYPRYFFTAMPPLMLLAAWFIGKVLARFSSASGAMRWSPAAAATVSLLALPYAAALISDPASAPIPEADRVQVVTGWAGGYGLDDMAATIRAEETRSNDTPLVALVGERPLWAYQLGLYLAVGHAPNDTVPPAPTLKEVKDVTADVRSQLGVTPDVGLVAIVEGGSDAQAKWLATNAGFTLLRTYTGPGMHSFAVYGSAKFAS